MSRSIIKIEKSKSDLQWSQACQNERTKYMNLIEKGSFTELYLGIIKHEFGFIVGHNSFFLILNKFFLNPERFLIIFNPFVKLNNFSMVWCAGNDDILF